MAPTPQHPFYKPFQWEYWNYNTAVLMGQYVPGACVRTYVHYCVDAVQFEFVRGCARACGEVLVLCPSVLLVLIAILIVIVILMLRLILIPILILILLLIIFILILIILSLSLILILVLILILLVW